MPHTPGPWEVEDRRGAPLKNIRVIAAGPHEVCKVSDVHQRDYQGSFRGDHDAADAVDAIGLANARLIAAAPDLLAACKRAREVLGIQMASDLRGFTREEKDEIIRGHIDIKEIDAAIAKAEGTTPTPKGA